MNVPKDDTLLRENRDMYTVMVGKIIRLPREKGRGYIQWNSLYSCHVRPINFTAISLSLI